MDAESSKPGYDEAREELHILEMLYSEVWANISRLAKRPNFDSETGEVDLLVHEARQSALKGYKELAAHAYGRTVSGAKIDEEKGSESPFTYRIAQANVGSPDCHVIARNSPIATKLVAGQLNEEIEDNSDGTRYFKIRDTRAFEGPTNLNLPGEAPDFRSMLLHRRGLAEPVFVLGLRLFVEEGKQLPAITKSSQRVDLEKELKDFRLQEERGVITPIASLILEKLVVQDLFAEALLLQNFPDLVRAAFNGVEDEALDECVAEIRDLLASKKEGERLALTDDDLLGLIVAAALIADDFEHPNAPKHLYKVRRYNCVFIDEVQDFTEVEVFLMGMTALNKYNQITLSGDLCQRLQSNGAKQYQYLFPFIARSNQNRPVFLSRNFRQRDSLKFLSSGFRRVLQNDSRVEFDAKNVRPALVHSYSRREEMASLIFDKISAVSEYATVAVIVPTGQEAQEWHDLLSQDLATGLRPALLARREDLTRRFEIHFTEVYETKGLEFDIVIVPDLSSFKLENEIGLNQGYVSISRAKHSLLLGCNAKGTQNPAISKLIDHNLIKMHPLNSLE